MKQLFELGIYWFFFVPILLGIFIVLVYLVQYPFWIIKSKIEDRKYK